MSEVSDVSDSVFEAQCRLNGLVVSTPAQLEAARRLVVEAGKWPSIKIEPTPIEKAPTNTMLFLVTVPETVIVKGGPWGEDEKVVIDPEQVEADIRETLYLNGDLRFDKVQGANVKFIENEEVRKKIQELEPDLVYHFDEEPEVKP